MRLRRFITVLLSTILVFTMTACGRPAQEPVEYLIGVSQANMREPWRLVLMQELKDEAAKYPGIRLVFTDATQDGDKQEKDINRLLAYGIDLLIVSPCDAQKLTPVLGDVYQEIPVIVLDRGVEGFDYSLFIGPDNERIGRQAGDAVEKLNARNILELCGPARSQSSADRSRGFRAVVMEEHPEMTVDALTVEGESRDAAERLVAEYDGLAGVDVIFAHNDYMALGAYNAVVQAGLSNIRIIGIDGFTGKDGGLDLVRRGAISETISCPTGGREAIQFALDILQEASGVPKQVILRSHPVTLENVDEYEAGLYRESQKPVQPIRVGYAQVGTESGWRMANLASIKEAAADFGIELTAIDADQSQQRQIEAVRTFIAEDMDVIVLSPVVDSGWEEVLREAKEAEIPVLLSDRSIDVDGNDLYVTVISGDFVEEGRRAMRWLVQNIQETKPVKIMELRGTEGASPTIERHQGFEEVLRQNSNFSITYSEGGDFTQAGGREIVERYLATHDWDIDAIFSQNDDMALGALEALQAAGIASGTDVKIVSVDGTRQALTALQEGKLNCVVECSPTFGPQLMKAITDLMSGKELPLRIITDEKVFTQDTPKIEFKGRKY